MAGEKSVETLRVFFSGRGARDFLATQQLSTREQKLIEAAMATARTANPDIALMREADTLIREIQSREGAGKPFASVPKERGRVYNDTELGRMSSLRFRPDYDPLGNPDSLQGYYYSNWLKENIYGPIIILLLIAGAWWYTGSSDSDISGIFGLTAAKFPVARYHCEKNGQRLPENPEEIRERLKVLDEGRDRLGYWLGDGRVYYPLSDETKKADERVHHTLCIEAE